MRKYLVALALFGAGAGLSAQNPQTPARPEGILTAPQQSRDVIRRSVDLVTSDVIVRDDKGQFVANLAKARGGESPDCGCRLTDRGLSLAA